MQLLSRLWPRFVPLPLFLVVLFNPVAVVTSPIQASEEGSAQELAAQVWRYITTEESDQAGRLLSAILQRPDATVQALQELLRTGRPHSLQPVGLLPDEQVIVRDRTYQYSLSVPQSYEPTRDYALVVCLHGAGFTGEAYLDRWKT
ncbi:MAG: hypothetical protein M3M98_01855, partial [Nitrospirota bacterium]|nr:hypothetical protein [Nitrospirota bacterium]